MGGLFIIAADVVHNLSNQGLFWAPDTAFEDISSENVEPYLYLVQPGSVGRGEM